MIPILMTKEMMVLKNMKNPNSIKKYQIFCLSLIIFNIFAYQFTSYTQDEEMTFYWYCCYGDFFREIFGKTYGLTHWIRNFSWYIFPLTGILFIFKRKNRRFLIVNIILQTLGILTQIVALWNTWDFILSECWKYGKYWFAIFIPFIPYDGWYGDSPWWKTFFYLLNLIFGILLYRYYYKNHQTDIDRASFESYYVACIICIILSYAFGELYGYIWNNYLDPTRNWDDDYLFLYTMQYLS